MTVRTRRQRPRSRQRPGRRAPERAPGAAAEVAQSLPFAEARERTAGGPEDRAAYCCACGYVFVAPVSTTVGCPNCGGTQAW